MSEEIATPLKNFSASFEYKSEDGESHNVGVTVEYPEGEPKAVIQALTRTGQETFLLRAWASLTGLFDAPGEEEGDGTADVA